MFARILITTSLLGLLLGCTDAQRASIMTYGSSAHIVCFSGGNEVFRDESTGKVMQLDGDGISYRSKTTGKYVRAFADCLVLDQ